MLAASKSEKAAEDKKGKKSQQRPVSQQRSQGSKAQRTGSLPQLLFFTIIHKCK